MSSRVASESDAPRGVFVWRQRRPPFKNVPRGPMARRLGQHVVQKAHSFGSSLREEARQGLRRVQTTPRWVRIFLRVYHDYGLKHFMLIGILVIYQFIGAGIFYYCEASNEESKEMLWKERIRVNRTRFIEQIIPQMFNNTEFLFFITQAQTDTIESRLDSEIALYEKQLGIKYTDQKIRWDFWNAMLYAQTICTTIGYGHLYPSTAAGRVFTMLYAIIGIPLVLSILDDLGKLLTKMLKTPWYLIKCACRRMFRYCTKQTMAEIRKLDAEDKLDLEIFDLPIPIAIFVVIAWIFVCSATFCIWERDWDYFLAFYFFFISLSTIGLGDITPTQPKYLLMLFIYIIIGLSLVSMCINLIQAKLERTYEAGRAQLGAHSPAVIQEAQIEQMRERLGIKRRGSSLGVFRSGSSSHSLNRDLIQAALLNKQRMNKSVQTVLSFPSPSKNSTVCRTVNHQKMRFLPRSLSIDDVMKLVDTEEGDLVILTELVREESGISETSDTKSDSSSTQMVISKSFDANFNPTSLGQTCLSLPSSLATSMLRAGASQVVNLPSLSDLEAIEELEDRICLGRTTDVEAGSQMVHFRSRLSLIPEQHSVIDEDGEQSSAEEEDDDDDTRPLDSEYNNGSCNSDKSTPPPTDSRPSKSIGTFLGKMLGRRRSSSSSAH
ncbi:hypothetical protein QR680_006773 [Steinernema hermaphroditum]|uniref:Potassium channel domain-containing protein n=1 Tax=Steinernema hermaphroditum TaxID=289476 RepID=A0AA39LXY0_9BILA|nr:hypothetical protein QR680_006773 [Steinernema hermaphroditum]